MKLSSTEVYGAALAQAFLLETQQADYPRVVCGDELLKFLSQMEHAVGSNEAQYAARTVQSCKRFLFEDADGRFAVDFIGAELHSVAGEHPDIKHFVQAACDFAVGERDRFTVEGDEKLATRFRNLASYLESRMALWN